MKHELADKIMCGLFGMVLGIVIVMAVTFENDRLALEKHALDLEDCNATTSECISGFQDCNDIAQSCVDALDFINEKLSKGDEPI
jgi:hypothetical protein